MYDICANFLLKTQTSKWLLFILLSLIWGSSFILMKIGLQHLTAYQVASIRILSAGLVMLPFAVKGWKRVPKNKIVTVIIAGLLGNFFPAFLYCLAEIKIDSSLTSILKCTYTFMRHINWYCFLSTKITRNKMLGVIIGLIGLVLLPFASNGEISFANLSYASLVLVATICYGTTVHVVSHYLKELSSVDIASVAFSFFYSDMYFNSCLHRFFQPAILQQNGVAFSIFAACNIRRFGHSTCISLVLYAGEKCRFNICFTGYLWYSFYCSFVGIDLW